MICQRTWKEEKDQNRALRQSGTVCLSVLLCVKSKVSRVSHIINSTLERRMRSSRETNPDNKQSLAKEGMASVTSEWHSTRHFKQRLQKHKNYTIGKGFQQLFILTTRAYSHASGCVRLYSGTVVLWAKCWMNEWMSAQNFMAIQLVVVEVFRWTGRSTEWQAH